MKYQTLATKLIVGILGIGIIGGAGFWYYAENIKKDSVLYCTMEAKLCPDGSAVGRSGPKCEFQQCPVVDLGRQITLSVGNQATFKDGLVVSLTKINDSRCKSGVVCIWQGELSPSINIVGGNYGNKPQEVILGSETKKEVTKNGYTFTLQDVTEATATITVTQAATAVGKCFIGGCSSEICSDKQNVASTCIYKEEFACYKTAVCARQENGKCGWTQTATLSACLKNS